MTRHEAIEILEEVKMLDDSMFAYSQAYNDALEMAIEALQAQEPRTETQGRWERVGYDIVCCSVCGMPMNKTCVCFPDGKSGYYYIATKYCPHCGAKNEKGDCDG